MIKIDTENIFKINSKHGVSLEEFEKVQKHIPQYLEEIHKQKQGFYTIIDDKKTTTQIQEYADKNKDQHQHFVVLGIGGSALGTICLQQSLTHLFKQKKLHVIDNIDPIIIKELEETIDLKKTLFIVITKSGSTTETMSLYHYFAQKSDQFVFITGPQTSQLRTIAEEKNIPTFEVPENVGGRFSVLTAVGLLPAALIGINIQELIEGAKLQRENFLSTQNNQAFKLASIQHLLDKKGKNMTIIMPYAQKLIRLADWYKQLLAESIGKKNNRNGEEVYTGITPLNAIGVTDQHSQNQLYNEGPNDKLMIFIEVKEFGYDTKIPKLFENVTFKKLMHTEKKGTEQALTKNNRPNITIKVDSVCEKSLGALFMLFEASIAFLGEFYQINAFNQPGVELSKKITKELLTSS